MSEIFSYICTGIGCVLMFSTLRHIYTHVETMDKVKGAKVTTLDFAFFSVCIIIPIYYLSKITPDTRYTYAIFGVFLYFTVYLFCAFYHIRRFPFVMDKYREEVKVKKDKK